jgi:hypothetical protein
MCRAWVNFNGTGTVAIRASGNVSSITDNGTGDYTVNFTTAMVDANYAVVGTATQTNDTNADTGVVAMNRNTSELQQSTTAVRLDTQANSNTSGATVDCLYVFIAIFR